MPLISGHFRIRGTASGGSGATIGSNITLTNTDNPFTAKTIVGAGGVFDFDNLPVGSYQLVVTNEDGDLGAAFVKVGETEETVTTNLTVHPSTPPEDFGGAFGSAFVAAGLSFSGLNGSHVEDFAVVVPAGTKTLSITAGARSNTLFEYPHANGCDVSRQVGSWVYDDTKMTVMAFLNGQLIAAVSTTNCSVLVLLCQIRS